MCRQRFVQPVVMCYSHRKNAPKSRFSGILSNRRCVRFHSMISNKQNRHKTSGSLNLLYLLAGSAGINPVMLILSLFLLLAWKVSGFYGLDRVVLPAITAWLRHRPAKKGTLLR